MKIKLQRRMQKIIAIFFGSIISSIVLLFHYVGLITFRNSAISISKIPGETGVVSRWIFYKLTLKKIGNNFNIGYGSYIVYNTVTIGNRVTIEEYCIISQCHIGNDVIIAARVSTMSGKNHHYVDDLNKSFYDSGGETKAIILGNNLWIGTHAVIMEDVSAGTVVAGGAVVNKKFPENAIIGGVPAKIIRMRGTTK